MDDQERDSHTYNAWYWCEWDFWILRDDVVFTGSFPNGLTMSTHGLVSGTALTTGNYLVDVEVRTKYGSAQESVVVNVS